MKGLKCFTKYQKLFIILALFFVPFFILLKNTNSVGAVSVATRSFDLRYKADSNSQYVYQNGILYGSSNGVTISTGGGATIYQFTTSPVQAGGNSASIHFETNIVATWYFEQAFNPFVNLAQQNVIVCNSSPSASSTISRNLSTAVTLWGNSQASTLTLYGDVTVTGLTAGTDYQFVCAVGSTDYSFIDIPSLMGAANVWFEQNPLTISWFSDQSQALMQTQINQNNTIINQNDYIIEQDQQDRDDLQNQVGDTSDDASDAASSVTSGFSSLTTVITGFVNIILHPPASNCVIDADMGNMDLGDIDLCQLNPPPAIQVIATLLFIGFIIPFAYSLIMFLLKLLGDITEGS